MIASTINQKPGTIPSGFTLSSVQPKPVQTRLNSIDLLRGLIMLIMALDHTRDYFHRDAFLYDPTRLTHTNGALFFTRWITHFCAPIFVCLAGLSAYLYGAKRSKAALAKFLLTRGLILVIAEPLIITLLQTFNPTYPIINLQVIFAIGVSMIALSAIIFLSIPWILVTGILIVAGHNLLDGIVVKGDHGNALLWSLLHQPGSFSLGRVTLFIHYPVIAWIGIMTLGYCLGHFYTSGFSARQRKRRLLCLGSGAVAVFLLLRSTNVYGDPAPWSTQLKPGFSLLSFLNVTKYPPSLLYTLMTLGPALLFLAWMERPLPKVFQKITVLGRTPMFFYLIHLFLIHILAIMGAVWQDHSWTDMVLHTRVNSAPALKDYGFTLGTVYLLWMGIVVVLYPFCKSFDRYKRMHVASQPWLSYL